MILSRCGIAGSVHCGSACVHIGKKKFTYFVAFIIIFAEKCCVIQLHNLQIINMDRNLDSNQSSHLNLILKSPSMCHSFFHSSQIFPSCDWLNASFWQGSGIPMRGCVYLYSFSFLPQHIKGKSAQKIGMSIGTAVVNMIFPKWRYITA